MKLDNCGLVRLSPPCGTTQGKRPCTQKALDKDLCPESLEVSFEPQVCVCVLLDCFMFDGMHMTCVPKTRLRFKVAARTPNSRVTKALPGVLLDHDEQDGADGEATKQRRSSC